MPQQLKYPKELLEVAVRESASVAQVLRYLNLKQAGGTQSCISKRIKDYGISTAHFTGQAHNKGKTFEMKRKQAAEVFIKLPPGSTRPKRSLLKRTLLAAGVEEQCSACGLGTDWNDHRLVLHIDHVDGDWLNNTFENLRFLCPNCHSQTLTYGVKGLKRKPSYSNW